MKKTVFLWLLLCVCAFTTYIIYELPMILLPFKYVSLAYAIFIGTILILKRCAMPCCSRHMLGKGLKAFSLVTMLIYTIVIVDTFWFHSLVWFPGLLRYPIIDLYGICDFVFIVPGICWYLGQGEVNYHV